jgi:hypothetical protein
MIPPRELIVTAEILIRHSGYQGEPCYSRKSLKCNQGLLGTRSGAVGHGVGQLRPGKGVSLAVYKCRGVDEVAGSRWKRLTADATT